MNIIVYIGMDVHKESFTICSYTFESDKVQYLQKIPSDYKLVLKYIEKMRKVYSDNAEFICVYEAGCLGYELYNQLTAHGVQCKILAPSTMAITNTNRVKTDKRDAGNIARCLAFHTYSEVYVPTKEDDSAKEYIRMRDAQKKNLKSIKQQILALLLRHGKRYEDGKSYWTIAHLKWIRTLDLGGILQETLEEYMITYDYLIDKINRLDERIEEIASGERYAEKVKALSCFIGIKTHTALSFLSEVEDFRRFPKAGNFAAFLGLVPSESSSSENQNRYGITKKGNTHLRRLLTEAAQGYTRGQVGNKSVALKKRQSGNSPKVIAYADRANERLRRKYYTMTLKNGINANVAKTAVARELACFIWGMMTENIE